MEIQREEIPEMTLCLSSGSNSVGTEEDRARLQVQDGVSVRETVSNIAPSQRASQMTILT